MYNDSVVLVYHLLWELEFCNANGAAGSLFTVY